MPATAATTPNRASTPAPPPLMEWAMATRPASMSTNETMIVVCIDTHIPLPAITWAMPCGSFGVPGGGGCQPAPAARRPWPNLRQPGTAIA